MRDGLRYGEVQDVLKMAEVLAEHLQRRGGSLAVGGTAVRPLHRRDGHVGQLIGDGVGVVAVWPEPAGDPVAHADHGQRGDPGVDGPEPACAYPVPDVAFDRVVDAANELRERLDKLGLVAFCKTTGGKGLHVVTPLTLTRTAKVGWPEAKAMAREICVRMAADSPKKYLVTMTKKERAGRIFLDYLRNDRMATAVAPFSPRGRAGAPVSMPLTWNQVKRGLEPMRYTLWTVPALLSESAAWKDYCEGERRLLEALKRLKAGGQAAP